MFIIIYLTESKRITLVSLDPIHTVVLQVYALVRQGSLCEK